MSLTNIRKQRGYSQSKLAKVSGLNVRTLQSYEQGLKDIAKASAETVYKLAVALNVPMEVIIGKEKINAVNE